MTTKARLLSGSTISAYVGTVGAAATAVTPATGAITPLITDWSQMGQGKYDDSVTIEMQDERTQLRFQGSKGRISEERRTVQGLMVTISVFDMTPQFVDRAWGGGITTTAATAGQVGVHRVSLDLPLVVPESGIELIIQSPFDEDGTEGWLGLIHLPKASLSVASLNLAIDPEAVALTIMQMDHSDDAFWDTVFADAP